MRNYLRYPSLGSLTTFLAIIAMFPLAATVHAQCNSCGAGGPALQTPMDGGTVQDYQGAACQNDCGALSDYSCSGTECWSPGNSCGPQTGGLLSRLFGRSSAAGNCGGRAGCLSCCGGMPGAGYVGEAPLPKYCGMPAPPYPVPYATPQNVGYTYYAYPPLMPHHSLPHYRNIYSFRHGPGLSRTNVFWHPATFRNALAKIHHIVELPR